MTVFGIRHSVFGLRSSNTGIRYSVFGIRAAGFRSRYSAFGLWGNAQGAGRIGQSAMGIVRVAGHRRITIDD